MSSIKIVEGVWKDFYIRPVIPSDIRPILQHCKDNLHKDETLSTIFPPSDKYIDESNERIGKHLKTCLDYCFLALEKKSGKIAALQFCFKWDRDVAIAQSKAEKAEIWGSKEIPKLRQIQDKIFEPFEKVQLSLFDRYSSTEEPFETIIWNWIVSTDREFRQQGLASEMYRRMILFLKKEKMPLVFSIYTSPFSQRCAEKNGFECLEKVYYTQAKDSKTGELILPKGKGKSGDSGALMAKLLI